MLFYSENKNQQMKKFKENVITLYFITLYFNTFL